MFNVARPSQRYDSFNGLTTSFVADPLASSAYDDPADPWSGTGTPAPQPEPPSDFSNILGANTSLAQGTDLVPSPQSR